jgi:sulfide:quinone oxidoreductase
VQLVFASGLDSILGIQEYADVLNGVIDRYGITTRYQIEMVEIHPRRKEAVFRPRNQPDGPRTTIPYDILHAVPPQTAPPVIRASALADPARSQEGWIDVDQGTLQHLRFPNVFAVGDVAGSPNAKTGAAAARQAPVVAQNLVALLAGKAPTAAYDGYIACPIVTGYGRMLLCEQDYTGGPRPRLKGIDTIRERYDMWLLKRYGLPWLYWNRLLKGKTSPFLRNALAESTAPVNALS